MYVGDRLPEVEMMAVSLPATQRRMRKVLHQEDQYADTSPGGWTPSWGAS